MINQAIRNTLLLWIVCLFNGVISLSCYAELRLDEHFSEQRLAPEISYLCDGIKDKNINNIQSFALTVEK